MAESDQITSHSSCNADEVSEMCVWLTVDFYTKISKGSSGAQIFEE